MTDYDHLFELNELAIKDAARYPKKREFYHTLVKEKGKHFTGITGPRGVGKTVIMKQMAVGGIREDFAAEMLQMRDLEFHYLKSTRGTKTPDFLVKQETREVKERCQANYLFFKLGSF